MADRAHNNFGFSNDIRCACCGKIINKCPENAIVKVIYRFKDDGTKEYVSAIPVCRRDCDFSIPVPENMCDGWFDLTDLFNPLTYVDKVLSLLSVTNNAGVMFTEEAMSSMKNLLYNTAPYVFRNATDAEMVEYRNLFQYFL